MAPEVLDEPPPAGLNDFGCELWRVATAALGSRDPMLAQVGLCIRGQLRAEVREKELEAEVARLKIALKDSYTCTASRIRDIATRIGVAAWPDYVRDRLDAEANQLEAWARIP